MFDQLKQIQEMKRIQDQMKQERETVQKKGITVTVNGTLEVERITLNPALSQAEAERALVECINDANKSLQKRIAKTMMGSGMLKGF
jgi:DNA-binding protein YbaB